MTSRAAALGLALLAFACSGRPDAPATTTPAPRLRVAMDLWPGFYPLIVARERHLFDSLGVDVDLTIPENTDAMRADFAAGRIDVIASSLADQILLADVAPDLRMVACTDESLGADVIAARKGITSVAQLRGKRIGLNLGSFSELLLSRMLTKAGVKESEVSIVNADASKVPELLAQGSIDAGETWDPYTAQLAAAGSTVLFSSRETPGLIVDCLVVRGAVVIDREREVRALVRGYFAGLDRLRTDSAGSGSLLASVLKRPVSDVRPRGLHALDQQENLRRFDHPDDADGFRRVADEYVRFFGRRGGLRNAPVLDRFLDPRFVR